MSTGKRLAKRSIIGTRVCAPGEDGKYYSGVIHAVKTPASAASESGLSITPKTRYSVRFDSVPGGRPPSPSTEYSDRDLIGPGFGSATSARLVPGQKVYLTYNGREIHAEVTQHREHLDEVDVIIAPNGQEVSHLPIYFFSLSFPFSLLRGNHRHGDNPRDAAIFTYSFTIFQIFFRYYNYYS